MRGKLPILTILGALLVIGLPISSPAQAKGRLGVGGGVNVSSISPNEFGVYTYEPATRGAFYTYYDIVGSNVAVRLETGITGRGAATDGREIRSTYLDAGTFLILGGQGKSGAYVLAGPVVSTLLEAKVDWAGNTTDVSDLMNTTDVGGAVGFGVRLSIVEFQWRYNFGFMDSVMDESTEVKNRGMQMMMGISANIQ